MRISGPSRSAGPAGNGGPRKADGGGATFQPGGADPVVRAPAPVSTFAMSGLEALIALQSVDVDRRGSARRRAVKRGHDLLDVLEEMKIGLLSGSIPNDALDRIADLVGSLEATGEEALDALIADIALRAEVELAKRGRYVAGR